jgi:hypothetical protein
MAIYSIELTEISRGFWKKAKESPALYLWFSIILGFSVIMAAKLTEYEMQTPFPIDMDQIFFAVFFLFMLKATADFHRYFVSSKRMEYLLALPVSHSKVSAGVFNTVFWMNMGLWTLFSSSYIYLLYIFGTYIGYPWLYLKFTIGVALSVIIGVEVATHYFSKKRYLLLIPVIFIAYLWYFHDLFSTIIALLISSLYLPFSLRISYHSFGFVHRKERKGQIKDASIPRNPVDAMCWKEMKIMWRERLISSFVFTSISVGIGSAYIAMHMDISLIPPKIRPILVPSLPFVFLFLGVFIVASYLFIFPMLNVFLAEEDTMWMLKHLPLSGKDIIKGKMLSISLPLIASLPFPFYFMLFSSVRYLYLGFSMLFMAFFISGALSLPFGIRYAGKKSDVMLLYTLSVIFFAVLSMGAYAMKRLSTMGIAGFSGIVLIITGSALLMLISMEISGKMMEKRWI